MIENGEASKKFGPYTNKVGISLDMIDLQISKSICFVSEIMKSENIYDRRITTSINIWSISPAISQNLRLTVFFCTTTYMLKLPSTLGV